MIDHFLNWMASAAAAVALLGLLQIAAPYLGFAIRPGVPGLLVAAVLGVPGIILLLVLHLVFFLL